MKKLIVMCSVVAVISCFSIPVDAASLFLDSWGVTATNLTPTTAPSNTTYVQEVYTGSDPHGQVGPGYGGYEFDAKSSYIGFDGSKTYLAVVTGLPQAGSKDFWRYNNPSYNANDWNQSREKYWYVPGSLALDIGGDGNYDFAVTTRLNSDQATYAPTPGEGMLVSGNLQFQKSQAWSSETNSTNWGGASDPWDVSGYDNIVDLGADFSYSYLGDADGEDTFIIEAIIDTALLGLNPGDILDMHWTMECGNDAIDVIATVGPDDITATVPEPATLLLLGSGIVGIVGLRKKFRV